jgi:hypothetical protein
MKILGTAETLDMTGFVAIGNKKNYFLPIVANKSCTHFI